MVIGLQSPTVFGEVIQVTHKKTITISDNEFVYIGSTSDSANNVYIAYLDGYMRLEMSKASNVYLLEPSGQNHIMTKSNSLGFSPSGEGGGSLALNPNFQKIIDDAPTGEITDELYHDIIIDVVLLYTPDAEDVTSQREIQMMGNLGIAKTNNAFDSSDIPIQLNRVDVSGAGRGYVDSNDLELDLNRLVTVGDGYLERGNAVRNNEDADIGILFLTHSDKNYCGRATMILAQENNAFVAINVNCDSNTPIGTVITHEVGHLLGARHDVATGGYHDIPTPYAHGYRDTANGLSSVMAYPAGTDWRNEWSDPSEYFERTNVISGTETRENNALVVLQTGPQIASFKGNDETYVPRDNTAPIISIASPTPLQVLDTSSIQVMGTVTENETTLTELTISLDSSSSISLPLSNTFSYNFDNLSDGPHTITVNATNSVGHDTSERILFTVDTSDRIPPIITTPPNKTFEATDIQTTLTDSQIGTATATDNRDSSPIITNDAPDLFPLGITIVTWTATDDSGNTISDAQIITIQDTTPPTITAPADITIEATTILTPLGISQIGISTATDNADSAPVITNDAPDSFPLGITTVTWIVSDSSANTATDTQTITIQDTTKPVFASYADIAKTISGTSGVVIFATPNAIDIFAVSVSCNPPSDSSFFIGITAVTCTATDVNGNSTTLSFNVIVSSAGDTISPSITAPDDKVFEATALNTPLTASQLGNAVASDDSGTIPTITSNATSLFPLGTHTILYTATDSSANVSTDTQSITVQDTTAPFILAPNDITVQTITPEPTISLGTPSTSDIFPVTTTNNVTSSFSVGTHNILWTATDSSGNNATDTQTVTVVASASIISHTNSPLQWGKNATSALNGIDFAPNSAVELYFLVYPSPSNDSHLRDENSPQYNPSYDVTSTDPARNDDVYQIHPVSVDGSGSFSLNISYVIPNQFDVCQDRLALFVYDVPESTSPVEGDLVYDDEVEITVKCSR